MAVSLRHLVSWWWKEDGRDRMKRNEGENNAMDWAVPGLHHFCLYSPALIYSAHQSISVTARPSADSTCWTNIRVGVRVWTCFVFFYCYHISTYSTYQQSRGLGSSSHYRYGCEVEYWRHARIPPFIPRGPVSRGTRTPWQRTLQGRYVPSGWGGSCGPRDEVDGWEEECLKPSV